MGLPKRDRRRIAEVGLRQWMDEVADAQLARRAQEKIKAVRKKQQRRAA
jgi:hypothetical protein